MKIIRLAASLLCAVSLCFFASAAQTPAPKPAAPPALSQLEQVEIENIQLKAQLLQNEEAQLRSQYAALAAQIGKEYPGYVLDPRTNQLVKAQTAPAPAKK